MISQDEARARVARGAAHLDIIKPGWHARIDTGTLTLWDPCGCVLGQLNGGDWRWIYHFTELFGLESDDRACACGFDIYSHEDLSDRGVSTEDNFRELQDAWIDAIAARLHPVREAIPTETPVTV
jgi:hypothetical protein